MLYQPPWTSIVREEMRSDCPCFELEKSYPFGDLYLLPSRNLAIRGRQTCYQPQSKYVIPGLLLNPKSSFSSSFISSSKLTVLLGPPPSLSSYAYFASNESGNLAETFIASKYMTLRFPRYLASDSDGIFATILVFSCRPLASRSSSTARSTKG